MKFLSVHGLLGLCWTKRQSAHAIVVGEIGRWGVQPSIITNDWYSRAIDTWTAVQSVHDVNAITSIV